MSAGLAGTAHRLIEADVCPEVNVRPDDDMVDVKWVLELLFVKPRARSSPVPNSGKIMLLNAQRRARS